MWLLTVKCSWVRFVTIRSTYMAFMIIKCNVSRVAHLMFLGLGTQFYLTHQQFTNTLDKAYSYVLNLTCRNIY